MQTAAAYKKIISNKGINQYQQDAILNSAPEELILRLYDLGILSIKKGDNKKANQVLTELMDALNFDYPEISIGFFRLYRYCQDCIYQNNTDEPLKILKELRSSWATAFNLS